MEIVHVDFFKSHVFQDLQIMCYYNWGAGEQNLTSPKKNFLELDIALGSLDGALSYGTVSFVAEKTVRNMKTTVPEKQCCEQNTTYPSENYATDASKAVISTLFQNPTHPAIKTQCVD